MTLARALTLAFLVASFAAGAQAADVGDVAQSRKAGVERVDAWLPGRVQSAVALTDDRGPALWLYVPTGTRREGAIRKPDEHDACRAEPEVYLGELWRLDPDASGGPTLERVRDGLPTLTGSLRTHDLDGDGRQELIALLRGRIEVWPTSGEAPVVLARDPAIDPLTSHLAELAGETGPLLSVAELGQAGFFRFTADGTTPFRTVELPVEARFRRNEFRLRTRPTTPVGGRNAVPAYADPPQAVDKQRLTGHLVRPTVDDATIITWWARLPEPEELLEMRYLTLGGEPALFVTTRVAYKLALFGEKRVRLFRLEADRSQTGHQPFFAAETRANLWQSIVPYVHDVNGDGHHDLVLAYWKGLTGSRIVLDTYLADGAGSYGKNPTTTGFDVKKGERSYVSYERDVTGDGVTDLLVIGKGRLQVHSGDPAARRGKALVATKPVHQVLIVADAKGDEEVEVDIELGSSGMQLAGERLSSRGARLVDVDGDGVYGAIFSVPDDGKWKVSFVRFYP